MSILIKGMSKPKTCDDCIVPLSECDYLQKRADDCPLIEIDDKEMNGLINLYKICKDTIDEIDNAPTILEAEE